MDALGIVRGPGGVAAASRPPGTPWVLAVRPYTVLVGSLAAMALGAIAATWDASDWRPLPIVGVLAAFTVVAELGSVPLSGIHVSSSFLAMALAMALLGPAPAALIGVCAGVADTLIFRKTLAQLLTNVSAFATVGLVGGTAMELVAGPAPRDTASATYALAVFGITIVAGALDFVMVCGLLKYR
ncbi:MAG: hypothetical protein QOE28_2363, partial [Solirubrobacteraceae bacterium]|nr:hypothetical protein [Solirubrobacteraceae bacterium]